MSNANLEYLGGGEGARMAEVSGWARQEEVTVRYG